MGIWLSLWLAPLISLAAWWMNTSQHWVNFQSEQIRLDAISLSLCHSRRNYLQESVLSLNELLEVLQSEMDALAVACSGPTTAACYVTTKSLLTASSVLAQGLQTQQDLKLRLYPALERHRMYSLIEQNRLDARALRPIGIWTAGPQASLRRSPLSEFHQSLEWRWGVPWPRQLVMSPSYLILNRIELAYVPERILSNERLQPKKVATTASSLSASRSACQIEALPIAGIRRCL